MLFTGDARYTVIPSAQTQDFLAVVAPHHGGDIRNNYVPARMPAPSDRVVLSYGQGNSYGHPAPITFKRHSGWMDFRTADRIQNFSGGADEPGHVGLFWTGVPPVPGPPCGGTQCTMKLVQV